MTVPAGEPVYDLGATNCTGCGLRWSTEALDDATDSVAALLFDDKGKADIEDILAGVADTEFAQETLRRVLGAPSPVEDWRVGEAIAETYLTNHRSCSFPWPDGRDERKSGSSLPGADLVGFIADDNGDCLAFGEVKTSSDQHHPPSTMYGSTGLKQQLEDLRDDESIRHHLVVYLAYRAPQAPWRQRFESATGRYLNNSSDVQLFGFLVRDVEPHEDDLRARVQSLGENCPHATQVELLALYLPAGTIKGIGTAIASYSPGSAS